MNLFFTIFAILYLIAPALAEVVVETRLRLPGYSCGSYKIKNLGTFENVEVCGDIAFSDPECTGNEIMWSHYTSWGCRCCEIMPSGPDEEVYKPNNSWNIYQYSLVTPTPSEEPTYSPSKAPTFSPTSLPTTEPTRRPSRDPTSSPTLEPTSAPTHLPTLSPTSQPTSEPSQAPSPNPTSSPTSKPTNTPSQLPTISPTPPPTQPPSQVPTSLPTPEPSSTPSRSPTISPTSPPSNLPTTDNFCICPLMDQSECENTLCPLPCVWSSNACKYLTNDPTVNTKWHGFVELGQTHVVHATMEDRHAPRLIAERETEFLFTPTLDAQETAAPTIAPTETIVHNWGLEQTGLLEVTLPHQNQSWPVGFPQDESKLINTVSGETYYIPNDLPDVDIEFDLGSLRLLDGVFVKTWYVTSIGSVEIGINSFDGDDPVDPPNLPTNGWTFYNFEGWSGGTNKERTLVIPHKAARYVRIRFRGGNSSHNGKWGFRHIQISGQADGVVNDVPTNEETGVLEGTSYIPQSTSDVRVAGYSASGSLLGIIKARNPDNQRGILEQILTSSQLSPYTSDAWSATIPWNFVSEGNYVIIGVEDDTNPNKPLLHRLDFQNLAAFGEHTLLRTKVVIFGTPEEVDELDTYTFGGAKLARDMHGAMPSAEIKWTDSEDWHLPYLVQPTDDGPVVVHSEQERRTIMNVSESDPGYLREPGWEILKNQLVLKMNNANSGRGLAITDESGKSPYASYTWIAMGWALSVDNQDGTWGWNKLGGWSGWSGAASIGWCGMQPHDECGNLLIHELGHSQTMNHFTAGTSISWGIEDEYPLDGVNLETHPWGYDSVSRRFRTWYDPTSTNMATGKRDPMNGGKFVTPDTCFPQYTAYHAQKSQNWAQNSPQLLSAASSGVPVDGAYLYNEVTHQYDHLTGTNFDNQVGDEWDAMPPVHVGIPIITLVGTLGLNDDICQIYPAVRTASGNTFEMPDPFISGHGSVYNEGSYYVEIHFEDGSSEKGLIAVPKLSDSTVLRYFSLNVAIYRRPISAELWRTEDESYPNITHLSSATKLFTRTISLPTETFDGIPTTYKAGRGWLGASSDIIIKDLCTTSPDCITKSEAMNWRGKGSSVSFASSAVSSTTSSATVFEVPVTRLEDGTSHAVKVLASRFFEEGGSSHPLFGDNIFIPTFAHDVPPDSTHGVKFWAPYDYQDPSLPWGTYVSTQNAVEVMVDGIDGSINDWFRISVSFAKPEITETVDLNNGRFISNATFVAPESSIYFLSADPTVGPNSRVWGGGERTTLFVPLISTSCLDNNDEATTVTASIKAQQRKCGDTNYYQMNAGKTKNECEAQVVLELDNDEALNPWLFDETLTGCTLATDPMKPIVLEARRWHIPDAKMLLGTLSLKFTLSL